jgi:hypothetical protein
MPVIGTAPRRRGLLVGSLVIALVLPAVSAAPVSADTGGPGPGQVNALSARVHSEAAVIHQLTEQLDEARLSVNATSGRLVNVTRQHDAAVQVLGANRAILLEQALRAYMYGGAASDPVSMSADSDVTLGSEYLRVASGDLAATGDQLRQLVATLRSDQLMLQGAQQANLQATQQLEQLRTSAVSTATAEQVQLQSLQLQLDASNQAAAVAAGVSRVSATPGRAPSATQGLPVNNGLVSVIQQAAGLPAPATVAPATVAPAAAARAAATGGHIGGVWLQLRRCESSDNYTEDTGNGFYGAYQFSPSTWTGLGYPGRPDQESPAMQDDAAMKLQAQSGWGQWPACSAALGLM